jgi:nitroreductase
VEFKRVIGLRRSIRYYQPYRPVEREKVQVCLEAARLSSRAVNADFVQAIVVNRDDLSPEDRESLKTPTTTAQLDLAPVWIFWLIDATAPRIGQTSLKQLVDVGALTPSHGWSHAYVDNVVWPQVLQPILSDPGTAALVAAIEAGLAINQALLAAVDEGLGTQLTALNAANATRILGIPEHLVPIWIQLLGYSAESIEAGGQRPRTPFERIYFEGRYGQPYERDEEVVRQLTDDGMLMPQAPYPWRRDELRALSRMFGLPE